MSEFFSGALDPGWPHAILLSVAVLASFAVAAGIVVENPKWSAANVLVVGGVALEAICTLLLFGFDEGISNAQQERLAVLNRGTEDLKARNLALEAIIAPRSLRVEQQKEIGLALHQFSGRNVVVESYGLDADGALFAQQVVSTMKLAEIVPDDRTAAITPFGGFFSGVAVTGRDEALVDAILAALRDIGNIASGKPERPLNQGVRLTTGDIEKAENAADAVIVVGVKPLPVKTQ